ncbi:PepSY domain-containing protein [Pontibacterium granulatum]|uniref:PepSY domain-containing protein n=1 Tax=Pontibacterium granulatum TaxID=2036029 RepID=UPI00249A5729|nr:PepSY domain-containing protein [Pontibacterium granulatum]MDI3323784.1 PepSY domain-containing protein [Pontibacterium granulatum]
MKALLTSATILMLSATQVQAGPRCTDGNQESWIPADQMQQQIKDQGYTIKKFKVTRGGCYEIYGWDKAENKVEVYFHPVSGDVVKSKVE